MRGIWLWLSLPRYDTIHKLPPPGGGGAVDEGGERKKRIERDFFLAREWKGLCWEIVCESGIFREKAGVGRYWLFRKLKCLKNKETKSKFFFFFFKKIKIFLDTLFNRQRF